MRCTGCFRWKVQMQEGCRRRERRLEIQLTGEKFRRLDGCRFHFYILFRN